MEEKGIKPVAVVLKEEYKIKNGGVYLVNDILHTEREIDGNLLLESLFAENKMLESEIADIEKHLNSKKENLADNIHLVNEVLSVYKKVPKRLPNGVTEKDSNGEYVYTYVKAGR